jgi:hypothetical protein
MADHAMRDMQALGAAQRDILADRGDGVGDRVGDRAAARIMRAFDRLGVDLSPFVERDSGDATAVTPRTRA